MILCSIWDLGVSIGYYLVVVIISIVFMADSIILLQCLGLGLSIGVYILGVLFFCL